MHTANFSSGAQHFDTVLEQVARDFSAARYSQSQRGMCGFLNAFQCLVHCRQPKEFCPLRGLLVHNYQLEVNVKKLSEEALGRGSHSQGDK